MDRYVAASVQLKLRLPQTLEDYRNNLRRFLRAATSKQARLVILPELGGIMVIPPLLGDFRSSLLKRADLGGRAHATLWQRMVGAISGSAANLFKASLGASVAGLLDVDAPGVWNEYLGLFGSLAREFGVTLVAPSSYLPDPLDGVIRNISAVFGPSGELLGVQAKVMLSRDDQAFCQPGSTWEVIPTEMGALGIMIGSDVLYPEVGRLLAFQGAEVLVCQGACTSPAYFNKLRAGILARMQDNQLYAASAFLVGRNILDSGADFMGKSAIYAPQEMTPRYNGVLVEMGNHSSEGILTAEWDFAALKELWANDETSVRQHIPKPQVRQMLAEMYIRLQNTPRLADGEPVETAQSPAYIVSRPANLRPVITLDDLTVLASITSRWPPYVQEDTEDFDEETIDDWEPVPVDPETSENTPPGDILDGAIRYEEETDEMDALSKPGADLQKGDT